MKDRGNILPAWLQKAGYRTALIGKWLNGYGARDAHGEVPQGFDIWRGLLDVSAYDYYNFVMNRNGTLRTWGDASFARKLVEFANIEVTPNPRRPGRGAEEAERGLRAAALLLLGHPRARSDYSPDVTGRITEQPRPRPSATPASRSSSGGRPPRRTARTSRRRSWAARAADPRPAPRYAAAEQALQAAAAAELQRGRHRRQADQHAGQARRPMTEAQIHQLQLDYEGRAGSLRAVDDHVAQLVKTLRDTHQLKNTLIVFVSDNGWLQGEHRITGDKFLPYEESLRVPFILRGPGIPAGRTVHGQVSNVDFAPTLLDLAKARPGAPWTASR